MTKFIITTSNQITGDELTASYEADTEDKARVFAVEAASKHDSTHALFINIESIEQAGNYNAIIRLSRENNNLTVNYTCTHLLYEGELYEMLEDQTGDFYFMYNNNAVYIHLFEIGKYYIQEYNGDNDGYSGQRYIVVDSDNYDATGEHFSKREAVRECKDLNIVYKPTRKERELLKLHIANLIDADKLTTANVVKVADYILSIEDFQRKAFAKAVFREVSWLRETISANLGDVEL